MQRSCFSPERSRGCSNTTPGSQALPLGPSGASQSFARHRRESSGAVQFAYVTNFGSKNVSAYAIDATSGALTPLAGTPVESGHRALGNCDRSNRQVRLRSQRWLQRCFRLYHRCDERRAEKGERVAVCRGHQSHYVMAVDPSGKFAYVPNLGSNNISAYTIDATSGALTPVTGSPFSAGRGALRCGGRSFGQVRLCGQL